MTLHDGKDSARDSFYPLEMPSPKPRKPTFNNLATNLKTLMRLTEWSQSELMRRSGVSQRHISDIVNGRSDCTIEMANQLAHAFGLQGWHLIMPGLPDDLIQSPSVQKLVEAYIKADESGREFLDAAAKREHNRSAEKP